MIPVPSECDHFLAGIDLDDPDTKSQLASLIPYCMNGDMEGVERGFARIDPNLQAALTGLLKYAHSFTGKLLSRLGEDKAEEWPEKF